MGKKIYINRNEIALYLKDYFKNKDVEIIFYDNRLHDSNENYIYIHPSLLPAFDCEDAIEKAFTAGVRVSGVTVLNNDRIIAQYPVLIGINTHIDEFRDDIIEVEKRLVPAVIESIIEDRVFDFSDLFRHPCSHNNGCGGCNRCQ